MSSLSGFGSSAITVAIISSGFNNGPSTISTNDGIPTTLNKVASPPQDLTYNGGNYTVYNAASLSNNNNGINSSTFFNFKTSLLYVYVGSTFVQINKLTFVDFTVLKSIYIAANSPISVYGFGQGDSILRNCTSLTSINVDPNNPNLADVSGVLFDKNITYLLCYPCAKSGSSYIVPTTVTTIRSGGFTNILFTSITIPNSLTTIEQHGFYGSPSQTIYVNSVNTYIINGYTTQFPSGSTLVIDYEYPTITPAATQTVTYPATTSVTITPTSNSAGAFTFSLQAGFPAGTTIVPSTGVVTIGGLGTINVLLTQAANGIYAAITTPVAAGTINVQGSPTITPATTQSVGYPGTSSVTITPTSNSAGAFTFSLQAGFPAGTSIDSSTGVVTIGGLGTINILVTQAAAGIYTAVTTPVTAGTINVVAPTAPTITPNNRSVVYTTPTSVTITPTSNSTGTFTFSLQAGFPAGTSIVPSTGVVTIGGIGTIVVLVTQTAAGIYNAVTTPVVGGTITVTNTKTATITPTSDSPGAFTYSLDTPSSAIASINSSTGVVTVTGFGTINVYVTQAASGNYTAVTNPVLAGSIISVPTPIITPAATQNATYGQPSKVTVTPTSDSTGAFSFSLQPGYLGCTTVDPNTGVVTIGGTGTITVLATQAATSNYGPVTTPVLAGTIIVDFSPIPCFKENTLILTVDGYRPIQELRKGDLVKTLNHGYVGINTIGCKIIYNRKETIFFDKIFKCTNENYPEIFEDLYITGLHAVLVDKLTDEQLTQIKCVYNDNIFITDDKYRLPVCFDERATPHETDEDEQVVIFHLALDHENENLNYGIYANGLLVETTSIGLIKESGLIMLE